MTVNRPATQKRSPLKSEAAGDETTVVRYQGIEFHVPAEQEDWPTEAVECFQEGRHIQGTKILLGPGQWAVFNSRFPKLRQFSEFTEELAKALGFPGAGRADDDPAMAART